MRRDLKENHKNLDWWGGEGKTGIVGLWGQEQNTAHRAHTSGSPATQFCWGHHWVMAPGNFLPAPCIAKMLFVEISLLFFLQLS